MSTPGKTSETLNLAEALYDDASASNSLTSGSVKDTDNNKPQSDDVNANLDVKTGTPGATESFNKRLNDLDISFQEKVVTKESSSDFVVHEDWDAGVDELNRPPSPFRDSHTPRSDDAENSLNVLDMEHNELTVVKPEEDKNWKPQKGKVYSRVLEIQKSKPKKYTLTQFSKQDVIEEVEKLETVTPVNIDLIPCSKCGRKVAPGTMDRHLQFCFPK